MGKPDKAKVCGVLQLDVATWELSIVYVMYVANSLTHHKPQFKKL